jgi:hypothetical protein
VDGRLKPPESDAPWSGADAATGWLAGSIKAMERVLKVADLPVAVRSAR